MIVLHAIWHHQEDAARLHLWAETSYAPIVAAKRGGRKASSHPFALTHDTLREALSELVAGLLIAEASAETLPLNLPSTTSGPFSSPELIREEQRELSAPTFKAWSVPTIALEPGDALELLLALPDKLPSGVVAGSALRFWQITTRFAFELLSRQAYMPGLQAVPGQRETHWRAAWQVVLAPEDAERLNTLAALMPSACWSFLPPGAKQAMLPREITLHFLNTTIDAFVRAQLSARKFAPTAARGRRDRSTALPEQWLRGLSTPERTILLDSAPELQQFASTMAGWLGLLRPREKQAAFRTCFRLDPPVPVEGEDGSDWRVSFHLQANDDRSLLVPVEKVWQERSSTLTFLKRSFENPQERLLSDLGRASRLFPAIEESLRSARPSEVRLTTPQAYAFLRESAPLLEQSGFGVLVPPWWQKAAARLGVKLKVKPKGGSKTSSGLFGLDSIVSYDWTVSIGDMTLSAREFEKLVNLKMPLIQVRGQWVELRPEEVERAIAFFQKKRQNGQMTLGEALRTGLGDEMSELGLPVLDISGAGWLKDLLDQLSDNQKLTPITTPATFQGQLRPYQLKGVAWMAFLMQFGLGACLADSMGLGKCLDGKTPIYTNGVIKHAESIWESYTGEAVFDGEGYWAEPVKELLVNAIDETTGQIVQAPIKRLYRQHISASMRKVRLEDGSDITITYPHKLLTDKGWTNDLHTGDYVCVPAKLVWEGKPEDPDLVKFLAWQISEGYEVKEQNVLRITQKNSSVLEELHLCVLRLSAKHNIKINCPSIAHDGKQCFYLRITSVGYQRFLESKGYEWGKVSVEKSIPDFIMQADVESIRIFLRNYFEAEGSAIESMRSIEIATASPLMIQQLSILLRRFGIWMRISTKQKRATNGSGIARPYQIGVIGGNGARKFYQEIGFVSERKQQRLEKICERVSNTNIEGIPASEIMSQVIAATKLPPGHFDTHAVYVTGSQQFSSASLKRVVSAMDAILSGEAEQLYREKPASRWTMRTLTAYAQLDKQLLTATRTHLQHLLNQEVYYCRIKSIKEIQYDGWVYDFEIEEHHNFVANNILCHNTIQLITLLLHDREVKREETMSPDPTLLICPMSIVGNWQREVEKFAPSLKVMIHHGHERLSGEAFVEEARRHDIVITTYALALRDREHLAALDWEYVVVDEAQNIKNEAAKQTQAIKSISARHKIALTGTPVENRLSELWSIMEFLNPGYLGSATDFRKQFAIPIERFRDVDRSEALKRVVQPFMLRRLKTDKSIIADLPDKMEMKVFCNLTQEQASLYEAVVKEMLEQIEAADGIERKGLVLATLMKLKQICNHPAQFVADNSSLPGRSGKLARLEEMLEEVLAGGDKALIFSQFAEMGGLLRHHLQERFGCEVLFLHGGTPKKQRDAMVQRFQEEKRGAQLFILSLKAGGVGLNLTAANHVFHFDRWWNPAVENQATDRAFRIGQTKNVQVHKFVCVGTLEERIDMMIEQKKELAESIVGSGEGWLTEMSTAQLKELFALSREAVGE